MLVARDNRRGMTYLRRSGCSCDGRLVTQDWSLCFNEDYNREDMLGYFDNLGLHSCTLLKMQLKSDKIDLLNVAVNDLPCSSTGSYQQK